MEPSALLKAVNAAPLGVPPELAADRGHGRAFARAYLLREHFSEITDKLRAKPHGMCLSLTNDAPGRTAGVAFGMADGEHFAADQEGVARCDIRQCGDGK